MSNDTTPTQYYKVLVNGKSCHGGAMDWSLPTTKRDGTAKAGKWMSVPNVDDIKVCNYGIHLTNDFTRWLKPGCSVYEAEHGKIFGHDDDKIVTNRARLTREIERPDWWNRSCDFIDHLTARWEVWQKDYGLLCEVDGVLYVYTTETE